MEETTIHYQFENGSVAERVISGGTGDASPPVGASEITKEQYDAALAVIKEANEQQEAEERAAEQARIGADYEALRALGVPEDTARRLTGYTGPDQPDAF